MTNIVTDILLISLSFLITGETMELVDTTPNFALPTLQKVSSWPTVVLIGWKTISSLHSQLTNQRVPKQHPANLLLHLLPLQLVWFVIENIWAFTIRWGLQSCHAPLGSRHCFSAQFIETPGKWPSKVTVAKHLWGGWRPETWRQGISTKGTSL